ncbi:hypothetical protein JCM8547_002187 [Rhodosporidiobolus lusitaniae]
MVVPMRRYAAGTALACVSFAGQSSAADPSPVDAADPLPEAFPKGAGGDAPPLYPDVVPPVAGSTASPSSPDAAAQPTLRALRGPQYTLGPFRLHPAEFKMEGVMLVLLVSYGLASLLIRKSNARKARQWFAANEEVYRREFAGVGLGKDKLYAGDGGDEFVSYATGRRGVVSVWTKVKTGGYDVVARLYDLVRGVSDAGYDSGADKVTIDFKLSPPEGTPGAKFTFAVIKREILKRIRDERWDLRTFTTTSEFTGLSPLVIALTESGDVTNALLKDQDTALLDAVKPGAPELEFFESLVVSDMPAEEPSEVKPTLPTDEFHLVLTLRLPPASKSAATKPWIELACNIADVINGKQKLVPEVAINKAKKRRADVLETLLKPLREEEAERAKEARADAAALKRKMEADKREAQLAKMTPQERARAQAKEEEKQRKKVLQKQVRRR